MTSQKENLAPAATGNEGNELGNGSVTTSYLPYGPDHTRTHFRTWGGDDLPKTDFIRVILPLETVQRMHACGPQLVDVSRACVDAQSAEARKQREEEAAKERDEKLRRLRREIEGTAYADEIEALEDKLTEIYARVDAEAQARLDSEGSN